MTFLKYNSCNYLLEEYISQCNQKKWQSNLNRESLIQIIINYNVIAMMRNWLQKAKRTKDTKAFEDSSVKEQPFS